MSLTTHRFRTFQTLTLARTWLNQIGIPSDHIEVGAMGMPSMSVHTEFGRFPEVELIINAAELTEVDPWPAFDEFGSTIEFPRPAESIPIDRTNTSPIAWHPID